MTVHDGLILYDGLLNFIFIFGQTLCSASEDSIQVPNIGGYYEPSPRTSLKIRNSLSNSQCPLGSARGIAQAVTTSIRPLQVRWTFPKSSTYNFSWLLTNFILLPLLLVSRASYYTTIDAMNSTRLKFHNLTRKCMADKLKQGSALLCLAQTLFLFWPSFFSAALQLVGSLSCHILAAEL